MIPLEEVDASISRPVIFEVARQVMEKTGIPSTTRIVFAGDADSVYQAGSEIRLSKEDPEPYLSGESQLYIEVAETPIIELMTTEDIVINNGNPSLFRDPALDITVKPVKKQVEVVISFRYRARSKTYAEKWKNSIWATVANQRDLDIHTASYSYPFPKYFIKFIEYFHTLRERVAGYGHTFQEYFENHVASEVTDVSNLAGKAKTPYIAETQTRILGMYDFTGEPEKANKDSESSTWSTEFNYKFTYEKTTHAVIYFPVAIHNQLVDERFFGELPQMLEEKQQKYSNTGLANRNFESDNILAGLVKRYPKAVRIPKHDDIIYNEVVPHTKTLWSAIVELEDNTNILFNLRDLEVMGFSPVVMDYISKEGYKWITKPYACMLNMSLYRNKHVTSPANLLVDQDLNVRAVAGTDIRKINRVRISYYDTITAVMPEALIRLNEFPEALRALVKAGDTKAVDIRRMRPRVDLNWLIPDLTVQQSRPQEFFDWNAVMDRATVMGSHNRVLRNKGI